MADELKSDRTSVTISKRVHRLFKVACAKIGFSQREVLEAIITDWLRQHPWGEEPSEKEE